MNHNIHDTISSLAVDIDTLLPLPGNPRVGNVDAIMASYEEFGQVKPIVVRPNDDGTATVIAGNHQLEAAKRLGWTHIAVVPMEADDKRAMAFAMADNRTVELGYTEPDLLATILTEIGDEYVDLLDNLGWDDFEMAAITESAASSGQSILSEGYIPPTIVQPIDSPPKQRIEVEIDEESGDGKIVAPAGLDQAIAAIAGSLASDAGSGKKAVVQYTLVFDDSEQQRKWYTFIRWLRTEPSIDGDTTAERLMNFIDAHANF